MRGRCGTFGRRRIGIRLRNLGFGLQRVLEFVAVNMTTRLVQRVRRQANDLLTIYHWPCLGTASSLVGLRLHSAADLQWARGGFHFTKVTGIFAS